MLHVVGAFVPPLREMVEMLYAFDEPLILDCSKIERAFGLRPTPLEEALAETVAWWRADAATDTAG